MVSIIIKGRLIFLLAAYLLSFYLNVFIRQRKFVLERVLIKFLITFVISNDFHIFSWHFTFCSHSMLCMVFIGTIVKVLADYMADTKENVDDNLLGSFHERNPVI